MDKWIDGQAADKWVEWADGRTDCLTNVYNSSFPNDCHHNSPLTEFNVIRALDHGTNFIRRVLFANLHFNPKFSNGGFWALFLTV